MITHEKGKKAVLSVAAGIYVTNETGVDFTVTAQYASVFLEANRNVLNAGFRAFDRHQDSDSGEFRRPMKGDEEAALSVPRTVKTNTMAERTDYSGPTRQ